MSALNGCESYVLNRTRTIVMHSFVSSVRIPLSFVSKERIPYVFWRKLAATQPYVLDTLLTVGNWL